MKLTSRMIIVAVLGTAFAFLLNGNAPLGSMLWPPPAGGHGPSSGQLPFFMLLTLISSVGFGVGITFLIFGWSAVKAVRPESRSHALGLHISTAWLLVNWVPHENLHIANGMNMQGLLYIEYAFHVTSIAAGITMIWALSHFAGQFVQSQSSQPANSVRAGAASR